MATQVYALSRDLPVVFKQAKVKPLCVLVIACTEISAFNLRQLDSNTNRDGTRSTNPRPAHI